MQKSLNHTSLCGRVGGWMQFRKRLAVFQSEVMDEEGLRLLQNVFQAFDFFDLSKRVVWEQALIYL